MADSLSSFGIKHHPQGSSWPWGSRTCIDVRGFANPHEDKSLRGRNGRDPAVIAYIQAGPRFEAKYAALLDIVRKSRGHVALYCVGGQHRSVYLADRLARDLGLSPAAHIDLEE